MKTKFIDSNEKTISAVINHVKNNIIEQTDFYPGIITLLKFYLAPPASNDVGKRSASPMCHVKNWVRSTMSQERLNHCMLLLINKEKTDETNLKDVIFCETNEERRCNFSIFCDRELQLNV